MLYGDFAPDGLTCELMRSPEILRLRGVRLSNVDAWSAPGFASASRYEHIWGVARLVVGHIKSHDYDEATAVNLLIAAIYHDIATPAFGHSLESLLDGYDHEREANALLGLGESDYNWKSRPIYAGQSVGISRILRRLGLERKADLHVIASFIVGKGPIGKLVSSDLDLDNLDNVTRAAHYIGLNVSRHAPVALAQGLRSFGDAVLVDGDEQKEHLDTWIATRNALYSVFATWEPMVQREAALNSLLAAAIRENLLPRELWFCTDDELMRILYNSSVRGVRDRTRRYLLDEPLRLVLEKPISVSRKAWRQNRLLLDAQLEDAVGYEVATIAKWRREWIVIGATAGQSDLFGSYTVREATGHPTEGRLRVYLGSRLRQGDQVWRIGGGRDFKTLATRLECEIDRFFGSK